MSTNDLAKKMTAALNRVCKWRALYAGWQLGTRPKGEPESDAVRDHRELTILLRVEASAVTDLLFKKNIITEQEWMEAMERNANALEADFQRRFPGIRASDNGLIVDPVVARETMKGWKP